MNEVMMHLKEDSKVNSQIWMAISDWDLNEEIDSPLADRIQAAFESNEPGALIYQGNLPELALLNIRRRVAAHPDDLKNHVKRFYLAMINRCAAEVTGALIDLVIMLRYRGNALSLRLIRESTPLLGEELTTRLQAIVEARQINQVVQFDTSRSVLVNGMALPAVYKKEAKS